MTYEMPYTPKTLCHCTESPEDHYPKHTHCRDGVITVTELDAHRKKQEITSEQLSAEYWKTIATMMMTIVQDAEDTEGAVQSLSNQAEILYRLADNDQVV